jgi:hypothetical protein
MAVPKSCGGRIPHGLGAATDAWCVQDGCDTRAGVASRFRELNFKAFNSSGEEETKGKKREE